MAASGNTGGAQLATTVSPFILRGAIACPSELRHRVWQRLATDLRPNRLDDIATQDVGLDQLESALDRVLAGKARGRTLVTLE
ncbi:hypothetical protein ABT009_34070 [Streptomyces sp. NPDC002896]|uniref:hypothetical protein n=1 Tax=Streptomyces sp. NPDC002896 TaxID=3154438 RepID=UPI003334107A